jgi:hypothetical protein
MANNGSNGSGGGNTISPPRKRVSPSKYWCFTFNNYTKDELDQMVHTFEDMAVKYVFGREVGDSGTPHLQGYIECPTKIRPLEKFKTKKIHWEKRRGTSAQNITYCTKDGDYASNMKIPRPLMKVTKSDLRKEQIDIANLFVKPEEKFGRSIYWFWESRGAWGKTVLATYMVDQMGAIVVSGKAADAGYAVQMYIEEHGTGPDIVIMDIPRTKSACYISYESLENIKNGLFFSGKYKGNMVRFNRPHLIVFANEPPEMERMSGDRWVIEELI